MLMRLQTLSQHPLVLQTLHRVYQPKKQAVPVYIKNWIKDTDLKINLGIITAIDRTFVQRFVTSNSYAKYDQTLLNIALTLKYLSLSSMLTSTNSCSTHLLVALSYPYPHLQTHSYVPGKFKHSSVCISQ